MYLNNHKIQEGEIAHEFCKLLQSNLRNQEIVFQEEMLKGFINTTKNQQRIDILIRNSANNEVFAIEVKRDSSNSLINTDLKKLYEIKSSRPEIILF
jgi:uncharacterized protein (DUF342 family)